MPKKPAARNSSKRSGSKRNISAPSAPPPHPSVPVVGIGASAGGLEAFRELLEALPGDTGMAFVLISHLGNTRKSMLTELLSKVTKMPVTEVSGVVPVLPNHIYVIPPNTFLAMEDGTLSAQPLQSENRHGKVIDLFFRSLAEHRKSQAIGVVLSGTGSDGTLGLAAIKAEGGFAFAQDPGSAQYPDMPRSASAQFGSLDFVLPPAQIARELARVASHPYLRVAAPEKSAAESEFAEIYRRINGFTGVDFAQYKPSTIRRRIMRRMALCKMDNLAAYSKRLESDSSEVALLYQDLLINVTSFFRDTETFEYLQGRVLPDLLKRHRGDSPIRVWTAGCATGEEAYSVAMVFLEALEASGGPQIQIFATDISKSAIQVAREGRYPLSIDADVAPERLRRFFTKSDRGYQIAKHVRDLCIFAVQDVAKDPPFSRMDLIVCRNLLIYLGAPLQRKVLAIFHYALNPAGYLMLGTSETVEAASDVFHAVETKHKLYSKLPALRPPPLNLGRAELTEGARTGQRPAPIARAATNLAEEADRIVLSSYSPPGVLVNSSFNIVQFRGQTDRFLQAPAGQATFNLFKMAREGLALDLRAAIHHAKKTNGSVRKTGVRVQSGSGVVKLTLEVTPIMDKSGAGPGREPFYLVLFQAEDRPKRGKEAAGSLVPQSKRSRAEREISVLRAELAGTQEDLRSIIEEQETTNEELQSASEEILSSNEELQSTNEELETTKEELQATNEELITVNEELQDRISDLAKANSDLTNLIESADVAIVMLDTNLRIQRFTSAAQKVLNLIPSDVGRPLGDIKANLQVADLPRLIRDTITGTRNFEQDVQDLSGRSYVMKIRPSKTQDGKIEGAILALTDVEALLRSQENRLSLETSLRSLFREPPDLLLAASPSGLPLFVKPGDGGSVFKYLPPRDSEPFRRCLREALRTRSVAQIEVRSFRLIEAKGPVVLAVEPILSGDGVIAFGVRAIPQKKPASTPRRAASRSGATAE